MPPAAAPARMTRDAAERDALRTVAAWMADKRAPAIREHVAAKLDVRATWLSIQREIVRRLLADEPARVADAA